MKYNCDITKSSIYTTDFVNGPITRNLIWASTTKCVNILKSLAYYPFDSVRSRVYFNSYSTEEVQLMVKSYEKFGHLTKWIKTFLITMNSTIMQMSLS